MYSEQSGDLASPSARWYQFVEKDIGREQFVRDMAHFVGTKYQAEALYCLGWFGGRAELPVVASGLESSDARIARVALHSFNLLSGKNFASAGAAAEWWRSARIGTRSGAEGSGRDGGRRSGETGGG